MEAVKEAVQPASGPSTPLRTDTKPADDIMAQIAALLQAAGYEGLGVVAIGPRGTAVNPLEFLPTGDWRLQVVPVKARDD